MQELTQCFLIISKFLLLTMNRISLFHQSKPHMCQSKFSFKHYANWRMLSFLVCVNNESCRKFCVVWVQVNLGQTLDKNIKENSWAQFIYEVLSSSENFWLSKPWFTIIYYNMAKEIISVFSFCCLWVESFMEDQKQIRGILAIWERHSF